MPGGAGRAGRALHAAGAARRRARAAARAGAALQRGHRPRHGEDRLAGPRLSARCSRIYTSLDILLC